MLLGVCMTLLLVSGAFAQGSHPGMADYKKAEALRRQNKCAEALPYYEDAIQKEPDFYRYHFAAGRCYYKIQKWDLALSAFQRCMQIKPDYTPSYALSANIYIRQKEYTQAINMFEGAAQNEKNPQKQVRYYLKIVQLLAKSGSDDQIPFYVSKAKQIDPNNKDILYYEGKAYVDAGNYSSAIGPLSAAYEQVKNDPPAKMAKYAYQLGVAYARSGQYDQAKKVFEKINFGKYARAIRGELARNSPGYYYKKAVSYYMLGEYSESKAQVNEAFKLQNNFGPGYLLLAKIAKKQGNYSEAIGHYSTAIGNEQDPKKKAKLQGSLARLQMSNGDYSGAINSADGYLSANSNNYKILYIRAFSQYKLGQYQSTISSLQAAVNSGKVQGSDKAKFNFLIGMAAKNSGDTETAKDAFKKAAGGPFKAAAMTEYEKLTKG